MSVSNAVAQIENLRRNPRWMVLDYPGNLMDERRSRTPAERIGAIDSSGFYPARTSVDIRPPAYPAKSSDFLPCLPSPSFN